VRRAHSTQSECGITPSEPGRWQRTFPQPQAIRER
jgi:hypothetical protein